MLRSILITILLGLTPLALSRPTSTAFSASLAADIDNIASAVSHHTSGASASSEEVRSSQGSIMASFEQEKRAGMDDYLWLSSSVHPGTSAVDPTSSPSQVTEHHDRHELARSEPDSKESEQGEQKTEAKAPNTSSKESSEEGATVVKKRTKVWRRRNWRRRAHP
ncbi:hypothetical protein I317_02672 [Kwoniella heveanensis CBS 569]|uniref:Uncharacterized protein n=1 Tax=Kwoniella heveanensis BCC8398 TaxID=1296120 RepID=A0A1B9H175_9TREE|nr:hypothetical protein I316_00911 [Kwoniella heveanensis BCC8398]OCF43522.1 hypothetical protein I317_02672 [Kwoniella heveanensis CBS 569]